MDTSLDYFRKGSYRPESLAYSSSGELSQAELDAWTKPGDSKHFAPAHATPGEGGQGATGRAGPGSAVFLSGSRGLKPNEVVALRQVRTKALAVFRALP